MTFDVKAFIVGEHSKFGGYEEIRPVEDAMLLGPGLLGGGPIPWLRDDIAAIVRVVNVDGGNLRMGHSSGGHNYQ